MFTISLCMIVKNEEEVLKRCLDSVADLVDEIIIVDTGSTDKTCEIAEMYTEHVYSFAWIDDFAAARNYSFSKAGMDYCMWMDADDVIEASDREAFKNFRRMMVQPADIVMMRYNVGFDENGMPSFWYYRERLIRNDSTHVWEGTVHEAITPNGKVIYSDVAVSHRKLHPGDADRNLKIYEKMIAEGTELQPRHQYYYGRELYYHKRYERALTVLEKFLELKDGWIENKIEACILCAECYYQQKEEVKALSMLFYSFRFDQPRAEVCCNIGNYFQEKGTYELAAYWYQQAIKADKNRQQGGFVQPDYYDYIPYLQLSVCYDRMGQIVKAAEYNEKAGKCKPGSKAYLYNKSYFSKIMKKETGRV